jgi:dihydropteroate synthase
MGVLNVTPDSFSDGGKFSTTEAAVAHGEQIAADGGDLIDIGGESTRPGSDPVPAEEQIRRVVPVIQALRKRLDIVISIDTTLSCVAQAALEAGADIINDISAGLGDPSILRLAAVRNIPLVLMHMQGTPKTMQLSPSYENVMREVAEFLLERIAAAEREGIKRDRILIDPGIGFGKTMEHNLTLIQRMSELTTLGRPMVVGASRKGFIGKITGETRPNERLFGTAATVAWSVANGASIVRVHDVRPMAQVVRMVTAIQHPNAEFLTA